MLIFLYSRNLTFKINSSYWLSSTPKELHKWIKIMLDAYHLNKEETDMREAKQMTQPVIIQRLFILRDTIEDEYLEQEKPPKYQTENKSEL